MNDQAETVKPVESVAISIDAASRINVAFHQNQVPVIGGIEVQNNTQSDLSDLVVEVTSTPDFLEAKRFTFDKIKSGGLQRLSPVPVSMKPALLMSLKEGVRGEIVVKVRSGGAELACLTHVCELLSPDEWTGATSAPELIAAFVRPNDPAVDAVWRRAALKLERAGRPSAMDGYAQGKKSRVWEVAEAVWAALSDEAITYALPPASFEKDGQKVRSPSAILDRKVGTCLDLTLMLAACYEQAGLNPIVILTKGHAFVGLWLISQEFTQPVIDEPQVLRKRRDLVDLILIETTLLTSRQRFNAAVEQGRGQIDEGAPKTFELAVDIRRARMRQIKPLHLADDKAGGYPTVQVNAAAEMDLADAPSFVDDVRISEDPLAALSRLDRWKRKLLDLSLRNKLLNFKAGKSAVCLVCPDPAVVEDKLAAGDKLRIQPKAKVMEGGDPRSAELNLQVAGDDAAKTYAKEALLRGDIHTDLEAAELDARLTDLFRSARAAMEEGGANSLHLALGFVRWSPSGKKGGFYRAPLILLPVALERRTALSGYKLVRHDDDARINPTLLQMLRQDFQVSIPEFEGPELPMDASGLDVRKIWSIARKHLLDAKGFEVVEDVVLSTFSFTKYLMWKDLVDRTDVLKRNPIVAHLIDTPTASYGEGGGLPDETRLDDEVLSKSLLMPLPADSSQTAAVLAASRGKDFVLFGPPGTGKSQTIANLIVNTLGEGKTVLFVSQKTTALEVVRKRLDKLEIGEFCLEVHSAKAQKAAVLGQLQHAWEVRTGEAVSQWEDKADELDQLRVRLNSVVLALHRRRRNGLTAYSALGRVISGRDRHSDLRLSFPQADYHDEPAMRRLRNLCGQLRIALATVGDPASHPLRVIRTAEWSPSWRSALSDVIRAFVEAASDYRAACAPVAELFATAVPDRPEAAVALLLLCAQVLNPGARDAMNLLEGDTADLERKLERWAEDRRKANEAARKLACVYTSGIYDLNLPGLLEEWRQASTSNFLVRGSRQKKVRQALAPFASPSPPNDLSFELVTLMEVSAARRKLQQHVAAMEAFGQLWEGDGTDPQKLSDALDWVEETRSAADKCAAEGFDAESCLAGVRRMLQGSPNDLKDGGRFHIALKHLDGACQALDDVRVSLADLVGTDGNLGLEPTDAWLSEALREVEAWSSSLHRSQSWCAWQRASADAALEGLEPLMTAVHQGRVSAEELSSAFELSYARWWVDRIVDAEKPLREFIGSFHEDAIARFVALDEEVAGLSRKVVTARLSKHVPPRNAFGNDAEWGTLSRELAKKARHMPIRQLFGQMPRALTALAPCMMMSPLSIAQFLPAEATPFDVVIFDEASQMPVWDAVGAIARGKQVIVVGDPKQLPPTTFFDRSDADADDAAEIEDLESILDECLAANIPHKRLNWHYRSRHESLIAFSNERYYDGRLVTFPSPVTDDRAVRYVHVPGGAYERGSGRVNRAEAHAVVADVVRRLRDPRFEAEKSSLGIVTFNSEQQKFIENLLDQERRGRPDIERFFGPEWHEPVFVKNLESVQGDERDVILFSVAYGPDVAGHVTQNYGPLNLDGGARRLNVAITRARSELLVFATLRPEQIDLSRAKGAGVRDFKHFLEFAQRGRVALAEAAAPTGREEDSEFEKAVRKALEARGWSVHPQVGVSGFRIDLGIVHPDAPGQYLAAVECDGATYHRSATARDRDKLREAVLRRLGWRVRRVWSTDWWNDADRALDELQTGLEADLAEQRSKDLQAKAMELPSDQSSVADAAAPSKTEPSLREESATPATRTKELAGAPSAAEAVQDERLQYAEGPVTTAHPLTVSAEYCVADLAAAGFRAEPERFHDASYRPVLRRMVAHVVSSEGPIYDDLLVRRIARFHDFQKAGSRIREAVLGVVERRFPHTMEGERKVFWPEGSAQLMDTCRISRSQERDHSDIPEVELQALAHLHLKEGATPHEAAMLMAADLGIGRLRQVTRDRLEAIAEKAGRRGI
jgi:very-short-patch-repair endonuclease